MMKCIAHHVRKTVQVSLFCGMQGGADPGLGEDASRSLRNPGSPSREHDAAGGRCNGWW
jgi:hypothetical protein